MIMFQPFIPTKASFYSHFPCFLPDFASALTPKPVISGSSYAEHALSIEEQICILLNR